MTGKTADRLLSVLIRGKPQGTGANRNKPEREGEKAWDRDRISVGPAGSDCLCREKRKKGDCRWRFSPTTGREAASRARGKRE